MDASQWPVGVRFFPSDWELLRCLREKICPRCSDPELIGVTDVYKFDPWDLPEQSLLKTGDRQRFFFSPIDRKYPNGIRLNRATPSGFWKVTGNDKSISLKDHIIGVQKTLIYYKGRGRTGERTDWVMHEYTMDEDELRKCNNAGDCFALYKLYKKSGSGPKNGEQFWAPAEENEEVECSKHEDLDPVADVNCLENLTAQEEPVLEPTTTIITTIAQENCGIFAPSPLSVDDFTNELFWKQSTLRFDGSPVRLESLVENLEEFIGNPETEVNQQLYQPFANGFQVNQEIGEWPFAHDESLRNSLVQQHSVPPEEHAIIQKNIGLDGSQVGSENLVENLEQLIGEPDTEVNQQHYQPFASESQADDMEFSMTNMNGICSEPPEVPQVMLASDSSELDLLVIEEDFIEMDDLWSPEPGNLANYDMHQYTDGSANGLPYHGSSMVLEEANQAVAHPGLIGDMADRFTYSWEESLLWSFSQSSNVSSSPAATNVLMVPPASGNTYGSSSSMNLSEVTMQQQGGREREGNGVSSAWIS